jgi:hypothetical protein
MMEVEVCQGRMTFEEHGKRLGVGYDAVRNGQGSEEGKVEQGEKMFPFIDIVDVLESECCEYRCIQGLEEEGLDEGWEGLQKTGLHMVPFPVCCGARYCLGDLSLRLG